MTVWFKTDWNAYEAGKVVTLPASVEADLVARGVAIYQDSVALWNTSRTGLIDQATGESIPLTPAAVNAIGTPGTLGFGVGVCPSPPAGYTPMFGAGDPASDNYGNYQYTDGSVMVWVPAFFYRIGNTASAVYAQHTVNAIDILPRSAFGTVAAANTAGWTLHRAFYDGGAEQPGVFVDKFQCSNNGGIASSIRNGNPLSSHADNNPFSGLTGCTVADNTYGGAFPAAKTRGAQFFPATRYIHAMLAMLATAHGQHSVGTSACAWYDAAYANNFPKGCNNGALGDHADAAVKYVGTGYSTAGKTGSGSPFERTTHNGQTCGIADLNGNMWEISPGLTALISSVSITAAAKSNPVSITVPAHGRSTGDLVVVASVGGMTQLNDRIYTVTVTDANTLTLDGVDGTAFGTYTSGGTVSGGAFYALSTAYAAKDLTGGQALATDQWGETGCAAHSVVVKPTFRTDYSQNGLDKRFGRGANQVLNNGLSGEGWILTGLGLPLAAGISDGTAGSNLFGNDEVNQQMRHMLCPLAGGYWSNWASAGVWAVRCLSARANSDAYAGFRAASYL